MRVEMMWVRSVHSVTVTEYSGTVTELTGKVTEYSRIMPGLAFFCAASVTVEKTRNEIKRNDTDGFPHPDRVARSASRSC